MAFAPDIDTVIGKIITALEGMTDFVAGRVHKYGYTVDQSADNLKSGDAWAVVHIDGGFGVRRVPFRIEVYKAIGEGTVGAEHTARAAVVDLSEDIMEALAPNTVAVDSETLHATYPEHDDQTGDRVTRAAGVWRFEVTGVYVRNPIEQ